MPNPQDSLKALLGGGQNIANQRVSVRNQQLADPRTSDAFRRLVMGENAAEEASQIEDPINQRYQAISEGQNAAQVAQVPEIARMHEQQLAEKERLATAPARVAGQFNVQAAQAAGKERAALAAENRDAITARQAVTQGNIGARQGVTQQAINDRQRVAGLMKGTIKAERPAGEGVLGRFFTGPSQTTLNQAEISRLQGQGGEEAGQADDFSNPEAGDRAETADGIQIVFDGAQWVAAE
jgi:hypothetical protein